MRGIAAVMTTEQNGPGAESSRESERLDGSDARGRRVSVEAGGRDGAEQTPGALWEQGVQQGEQRLSRRPLAAAATGLVGGFDVMIGVAVSNVLAGALSSVLPRPLAGTLGASVFGIGFVLITLGRSELFTENFLIPVGAVLEHRGRLRRLPTLWIPTLVANVLGMFIIALILAQSTVLSHRALMAAGHTADILAHRTTLAAFLSAILAGLVMTLWTWLGLAVRTDVGRMLAALVIGFTIAAPVMDHVIVGTGELMFGVLGGHTSATWGEVGENLLIALTGNLIGGTLFVTLSRFVQARADA